MTKTQYTLFILRLVGNTYLEIACCSQLLLFNIRNLIKQHFTLNLVSEVDNFTRPTPPICSTIVSLGAGEGVRRCEGECWDMNLVRSTVDKNVLPIASSLKYSSISTSTSSLSKGPSQGLGRQSTELQSNAFLEPLYSASFVFSI